MKTCPILILLLYCHAISGAILASPGVSRRDAVPVATFTVGPRSNYIPNRVTETVPSGTAAMIYPSGIIDDVPAQGIDVVFGPDLQSEIGKIMQSQCKGSQGDQCRDALVQLLQQSDVTLHSKRFVDLATFALGGIIGELIYLWNLPPFKVIHFSPDDLAQINSISTTSIIAFETDAATSNLGTMTIKPAPTLTQNAAVTITTLAHDADGHKQGDVIINLPADLAVRVEDFIAQMGGTAIEKVCSNAKSPTNKRVDTLEECLQRVLEQANILAENQEAFQQLVPVNQEVAPRINQMAVDAVEMEIIVVRVARRQPNLQRIPDREIVGYVLITLAMLWAVLLNAQHGILQVAIQKDALAKDQSNDIPACPKDLVCPNSNCRGDLSPPSLANLCSVGQYIMCPCEPVITPIDYQFSETDLNNQQAFLQELIGLADPAEVPPLCNYFETVAVETSWFKDEAAKVCKKHDELRKRDGSQSWEITTNAHDFNWEFGWTYTGVCGLSCEDVFDKFTTTSTCSNSTHTMASLGGISTKCGNATFGIFKPPGQYNISIHQEIEGANSFIEWSVYSLGNYQTFELGRRGNSPNVQPYKLTIYVDNPTDKDTTNVRFAAAAEEGDPEVTRWSTGSMKYNYKDQVQTKGNYVYASCDADKSPAAWVFRNGVWMRDFSCIYPNDYSKLPVPV